MGIISRRGKGGIYLEGKVKRDNEPRTASSIIHKWMGRGGEASRGGARRIYQEIKKVQDTNGYLVQFI